MSVTVQNSTVKTVVKSVVDHTIRGYDATYYGSSDAPDNEEGPDPEDARSRRADSLDDPKHCVTS